MLGSAATFRRALLHWYAIHRRDLPWRPPKTGNVSHPDPYHVLVSELMLQQTQVSTVIPYFKRFIARFPTLEELASADEQEVLRNWQGLGYYSRARNLQAAARRVVEEHGGVMPSDVARLRELPGIGRYTAGAVASLGFGIRAPILDGNVQRVLCRLDAVESDPRQPDTRKALWNRAEELVPARNPADFNSALMELGTLICMPRSPRCLTCPVKAHCAAFSQGIQDRIPPARKARPLPHVQRMMICLGNAKGRWLIEQRPATGRWARMWQFVTFEASTRVTRPQVSQALDRHLSITVNESQIRKLGEIEHALTHRHYTFSVFYCKLEQSDAMRAPDPTPRASVGAGRLAELTTPPARQWVHFDRLGDYPLPRPHLKAVELLSQIPGVTGV